VTVRFDAKLLFGVLVDPFHRIVTADKLRTVAERDLRVASLNLRTCATSQLARPDRDLVVGLYGEVVSELERRERTGN
jgi:hypothetical protein